MHIRVIIFLIWVCKASYFLGKSFTKKFKIAHKQILELTISLHNNSKKDKNSKSILTNFLFMDIYHITDLKRLMCLLLTYVNAFCVLFVVLVVYFDYLIPISRMTLLLSNFLNFCMFGTVQYFKAKL